MNQVSHLYKFIIFTFIFILGEDEEDFEKEEGFSSATSSPVKLPPPPPPHPANVGNRLQVIIGPTLPILQGL